MIEVSVEGLDELQANVATHLATLGLTGPDVVVRWKAGGPAAPYAVYVHENLAARHTVGGAKFFSQPLLQQAHTISAEIADLVRAGQTLPAAARVVAERILTLMKEATPVRYGALRASEHVEVT